MRQKPKGSLPKPSSFIKDAGDETNEQGRDGLNNAKKSKNVAVKAERSAYVIITLFVLVVYGGWRVYQYQFENLPLPLTLEQVGKRGFSEHEAVKHVEALTQLGPHPVGSDALETALLYVKEASELVKKNAHWEVDVEVDAFHVNYGANNLIGGLFKGKTLVYSDLNHIVLRITPKYASEASDNAILVSSHIDTVFAGEGAGDCSSCIAVMLELARGVSHSAHGFKNAVIFLFNTGEEEGLNGAHSFMTQHPWSDTVRIAIDLEAIGIGGKSSIFQTGPNPWAIEKFAEVAKYPSAQIAAEDLFTSGAIKSGTDFQVYNELGGLSGLDFAFSDHTAVYHTKNDKLKLLRPGSLQHLGENMLSFLKYAASSSSLLNETKTQATDDKAIYFDILGTYLIVFRQRFATMLYNSLILQSLLIWITSIFMGGFSALTSVALSVLSTVLMWLCSIGFSASVAFIIPIISSSPLPLVASPWLALGLFAAPALLGAFTGQHLGFLILNSYLHRTYVVRRSLPATLQATLAKLDAERWLYKGGLLQWFVLLIVGSYYKIGSTYLAFAWLVSPAFAYGLLEATLSPSRLPRQLKTATLVIGLFVPFVLSSGMVIRLTANIIGTSVRFVRNPGGVPDWLGNVIIAIVTAAIICLTMVYLLSYIHISGAKVPLIATTIILLALSLGAVWTGAIPPFTQDAARAVNVVHVVDARSENLEPKSFVSLFSTTPGNLIREADQIGEGFVCGREKYLDFVTFYANYSCWTENNARIGWTESDIPQIRVVEGDNRQETTLISIDTKASIRWSLAINTQAIEDFRLKDADGDVELTALGEKSNVDGWHTIQFSGGKNAPTKFNLYLSRNSQTRIEHGTNRDLLRLRTDLDRVTLQVETVLEKLPPWCSLFGKSTSPRTLAFLTSLPVESSLNNVP